jgi:hypothetical protein
MLWESAEIIRGKRSVMPPGWMPVPCSVTLPLRQASSMRGVPGLCGGKNHPIGVTTLTPDSRIRTTSEGFASSGL